LKLLNTLMKRGIKLTKNKSIRRGDIFLYDYGETTGSIQNGYRPVLVIQANNFNAKAPTIIVAAITTAVRKSYLPSHIVLDKDYGLSEPSMVMIEQLRSVNKDDLADYIGHIDGYSISKQINDAVKKTFGIPFYQKENVTNIRCLCSKHLAEYQSIPDYVVRRVDPLTSIKDKCDKCQNTGYDYYVSNKNWC